MKKIIFHYPGPFYKTLDGGEKKRPFMMCQAFEGLGYEVYKIIGSRKERKIKLNKIIHHLDEFDFIYSENSTLPLGLCGRYHLPSLSSSDYKLFKRAYSKHIPIGVFIRDIYWKYKSFSKEVGHIKHLLSIPFYQNEFKLYKKYSKVIFVPSNNFIKQISIINKNKCFVLPPGAEIIERSKKKHIIKLPIKLIYVGSIKPPIYDISELLDNVSKYKDKYHLTIVTRRDEWHLYSDFYKISPPNIRVIYLSGIKLKNKLLESDISLIYLNDSDYRKICMPLKLFEAIGAGLPIITKGDNSVTNFVKENKIGWCKEGLAKNNIFEHFIQNPQKIAEKTKNVLSIQKKHTWKERAKTVIKLLNNNL